MEMPYVAFGLRLACSFPLPGLRASNHPSADLPALELALCRSAELESMWSGDSGPPAWEGRLGDGRELTIRRGTEGDLLFVYADQARFRLDASMTRLDCAPAATGPRWQRALIGKVVPTVSVMLGYEGLHAAAVDSSEGVVGIMGASGSGKSTLAAELMRRDWPLLADDQLTLHRDGETILAHPGTAHMSFAASTPAELDPEALGTTLTWLDGERWLAAHNTSDAPRPVRMLCLLTRAPGLRTTASTLPSSPLPLAPYMLGLSADTRRQADRFSLYCDLVQSCTLVQLECDVDDPPQRLADLLEGALERHPQRVQAGAL